MLDIKTPARSGPGHVDKPASDLPTSPSGSPTTIDSGCWFPHDATRGLTDPLKEKPLAGTQLKNFGGYFAVTHGRVSAKLKLLVKAKRKRSESEA
jgi:hypothetical protein